MIIQLRGTFTYPDGSTARNSLLRLEIGAAGVQVARRPFLVDESGSEIAVGPIEGSGVFTQDDVDARVEILLEDKLGDISDALGTFLTGIAQLGSGEAKE